MLGIEKYTKGKQIDWWILVQVCSSRNSVYQLLIWCNTLSIKMSFFIQSRILENWSKRGALKSCSDTCLIVLFHGVFYGQIAHSKIVLPPYDFLPLWCYPNCMPLSPKTVLHIWHAPKEPYEIPWRTIDVSFQFKDMLPLPESLYNIWVVTFSLHLLQNI